jgi:hypothetical protein
MSVVIEIVRKISFSVRVKLDTWKGDFRDEELFCLPGH